MMHRLGLCAVLAVMLLWSERGAGQVPPTFGGVYIDAEGVVRYREVDTRGQLPPKPKRADSVKSEDQLCHISLPRLFAEVRELAAAGKPLPARIRYLGGLTQIRYIFVDPEEKDLVIAGPAEAWDAGNGLQPRGIVTGRPVMHLDDLVVALRVGGKGQVLGCTIDLPADALKRAQDAMSRAGTRSRQQLGQAVVEAIGPQKVAVFGAAADTRYATICVAADYKLKRLSLGLDPSPVAGVGHGVDDVRAAANRFWFELLYQPILMSAEGDAFEMRGQRLQLKCGAMTFDAKGATPGANRFAQQLTAKVPALAAALPILAELQNLADLTVLAALIEKDRLDRKVDWDRTWVMDGYRTEAHPTPKSAGTLVSFRGGSLAAGGVNLAAAGVVDPAAREADGQNVLRAHKRPIPAGRWCVNPAGE